MRVVLCCQQLTNMTRFCAEMQASVSEPDHVPLEGKLSVNLGEDRKGATD